MTLADRPTRTPVPRATPAHADPSARASLAAGEPAERAAQAGGGPADRHDAARRDDRHELTPDPATTRSAIQGDPAGPIVEIRPAAPTDGSAVLRLFESGQLWPAPSGGVAGIGGVDADDPAEDVLNFQSFYVDSDDAELWIAELPGQGPVGMVGLRHVSEDVAEMRRLRVREDMRGRGIGRALIEHALRLCVERSYLKLVLDTYVERRDAIALFERFGFQLGKERRSKDNGKPRLDFYLDLYRDPNGR